MNKISQAIAELYPTKKGVKYIFTKSDGSALNHPKDGIVAEKASDTKLLKENWDSIYEKAEALELQDALNVKIQQIEPLREEEQYADYDYNGTILNASEGAQTKLAQVSDIFNGLTEIPWFDAEDNQITLDHAKIREIKVGLFQRAYALYAKEKAIIAELKAITNVAELEAFDIVARWNA